MMLIYLIVLTTVILALSFSSTLARLRKLKVNCCARDDIEINGVVDRHRLKYALDIDDEGKVCKEPPGTSAERTKISAKNLGALDYRPKAQVTLKQKNTNQSSLSRGDESLKMNNVSVSTSTDRLELEMKSLLEDPDPSDNQEVTTTASIHREVYELTEDGDDRRRRIKTTSAAQN